MISLTCRRQWFGQPPYNKNEPWTRGNAAIQSDNETVAAAHAPGRPTSPRISCAPARIRGNSAFALAARRSPSGQEGGILCIICDPYGGKQHAPEGAATAKPIRTFGSAMAARCRTGVPARSAGEDQPARLIRLPARCLTTKTWSPIGLTCGVNLSAECGIARQP